MANYCIPSIKNFVKNNSFDLYLKISNDEWEIHGTGKILSFEDKDLNNVYVTFDYDNNFTNEFNTYKFVFHSKYKTELTIHKGKCEQKNNIYILHGISDKNRKLGDRLWYFETEIDV